MNKKVHSRTISVRYLTSAAIIATLYVIFTGISAMLGLASGVIQVRLSEALTVLPYFTPAAIPGVTLGCFLANLLTGAPLPDILFGTLATFLGVLGTSLLRKNKYLIALPTILSNMLIIPFVLQYGYGIKGSFFYFMLTIGAGEFISAGVLGWFLLHVLQKSKLSRHIRQ